MNKLKPIIESIIFAAGQSISYEELLSFLPEIDMKMLTSIIDELKEEYRGHKGIHLLTFKNKVQFSTNPDYGDIITEVLTPLKERALSKALLEVLSIIAYKEPVTRIDIEDIRGVSSEYALSVLLKMNLIKVIGRKDTAGRPSLYSTTEEFLKKFELQSLKDLPDYEIILERIKLIDEDYNQNEGLYKDVEISDTFSEEEIVYDSNEFNTH